MKTQVSGTGESLARALAMLQKSGTVDAVLLNFTPIPLAEQVSLIGVVLNSPASIFDGMGG